jgi:hypothetical protein
MDPAFSFDSYLLRRQVLALTGRFRVYDPRGTLVLYSEQRMFRLKEDIRLYRDESKTVELLRIQARQILDFSAAYDVVTFLWSAGGTLRRRAGGSLAIPGDQRPRRPTARPIEEMARPGTSPQVPRG